MARVLLIFPPTTYQIKGSVEGRGARKVSGLMPHLGLLYLARILKDNNYHVTYCDFTAKTYSDDYLKHLISQADITGITMQSFNRDSVRIIIDKINEFRPELPVMVGGPDLILHPRYIEGTSITAVGETEHTICQIVNTVLNGGDYSQLEGVVYKNADGIQWGKDCTLVKDLDIIPLPARELIDPEGFDFAGKRFTRRIANVLTSRGCPFSCRFCARNSAQGKYRTRSVKNVLDEIEHLVESGYRYLVFVDDEFLIRKKRVMEIMEGIIARKLNVRMAVQARTDSIDEEVIKTMKKAGVRLLIFGVESGNQETLDFFKKRNTVEQNRRAIELANANGLFTFGFFIVGAPHENYEHVQNTIDFAMNAPLDAATFNILDYTYGSELWNEAYEKGLIEAHEFNVPADKARGLGLLPKDELDKICSNAFDRFYKRPKLIGRYLWKLIKMREPWTIPMMSGVTRRIIRDFIG